MPRATHRVATRRRKKKVLKSSQGLLRRPKKTASHCKGDGCQSRGLRLPGPEKQEERFSQTLDHQNKCGSQTIRLNLCSFYLRFKKGWSDAGPENAFGDSSQRPQHF